MVRLVYGERYLRSEAVEEDFLLFWHGEDGKLLGDVTWCWSWRGGVDIGIRPSINMYIIHNPMHKTWLDSWIPNKVVSQLNGWNSSLSTITSTSLVYQIPRRLLSPRRLPLSKASWFCSFSGAISVVDGNRFDLRPGRIESLGIWTALTLSLFKFNLSLRHHCGDYNGNPSSEPVKQEWEVISPTHVR